MTLRAYEDVMKAVSDPTRVRILKILEGGELCVCQVIAVVGLGQSTISKHLFLLRAAGLIKDRKDRKWVHYSLDGKNGKPYAAEMLRNLRDWLNDDRSSPGTGNGRGWRETRGRPRAASGA
jgi:DNA-binding transcriptional ArsR family regulator